MATEANGRHRVLSTDGTPIAYDEQGEGPTVVLVGGALDDGAENAPLVPLLAAAGFTVVNPARRGRADSGDNARDAAPSVGREIEDLDALITAVGAPAHLYGVSSGGALALEATAAGLAVDRVAVYEVPWFVDDDVVARWHGYVDDLGPLLAAGRHDDALARFMQLAGTSDEDIAAARSSPYWAASAVLAPSLGHDAACLGDGRPPVERLARIDRPVLVATGAPVAHPSMPALPADAFARTADAIAGAIGPGARRATFAGQAHVADPAVVVENLVPFLDAGVDAR
jgi:hypothetical protein